MSNKNEILNELREIAPRLALLEKTNLYKVPEGYFTAFSKSILEQVKLGEVKVELREVAPELARLNKRVATDMPADYFKGFSAKLIQTVRAAEVKNELLEIAPELAKLQKAAAYSVPAGYFESFAGGILQQLSAEKPKASPGVSIFDSIETFLGRVFKPKYSVAFSGFATLVIVGMLVFMKPEPACADTDVECRIARLSNADINAYLNSHPDYNSEQIFDDASSNTVEVSNFAAYKEALKDVDDASLSEAIMD